MGDCLHERKLGFVYYQFAFYPGKLKDELDVDKSANSLENFFTSFVEEMKVAVLALGKDSLQKVGYEDLVSLNELTSKVTKVPLAYESVMPEPIPVLEQPKKNWNLFKKKIKKRGIPPPISKMQSLGHFHPMFGMYIPGLLSTR